MNCLNTISENQAVNIAARRARLGLSVAALAGRTGLSTSTIRRCERAGHEVRTQTRQRLVAALRVATWRALDLPPSDFSRLDLEPDRWPAAGPVDPSASRAGLWRRFSRWAVSIFGRFFRKSRKISAFPS